VIHLRTCPDCGTETRIHDPEKPWICPGCKTMCQEITYTIDMPIKVDNPRHCYKLNGIDVPKVKE